MNNYQCYLTARVWIFKSSEHDSFPILFIPWVHQSVLGMETLMVAPLVTLVAMLPFFHTCLVCGLDFGRAGSSFTTSSGSSSSTKLFFGD